MPIINSIPADQVVSVAPNVLSAGGTALQITGLALTHSSRPPTGGVVSFADAADVATYFGAGSAEAAVAEVYFNGYDGASLTPEAMLFAQYNASAVSAYLRGGNISALSLAQLQALTGSLSMVMDGYTNAITGQSLSAATSPSSAASILQTAFAANTPTVASYTASIGASATGTGTGTSLVLSSVVGRVSPGDAITGTGVPTNTTIVSGPLGGGAGTYITSQATTASAATITVNSTVLNVTAVTSGTLAIGQVLAGVGVTAATSIASLGTGTGAAGTYNLTGVAQNVVSETITSVAPAILVSYDSVSGAFILSSSITGVPSTAAFATGTLAPSLLLTQATGAVVSQGAVAASPAAFMTNITNVTQNWVTFFSIFDPDGGSGNAQKLAFAEWTAQQNDQYAYICWDTDASPTTTVPATTSLGYLLAQGNYSGTFLIYEPTNLYQAAFVSGTAAAVNYDQTNGRITFKFRTQSGLTPGVTSASVASNLAANGYNFYGAYATRNQNFTFLANGVVSGEFKWFDSYINQIQLNNALQLAILTGMTSVGSIPYNSAGYALIESFCADPINAALNFGTIRAGVTLSAEQITEINQAAGASIASVLQSRGWYLQVQDASPAVRANRGSPPCTLWYTDGGAVQTINLDSIEVQ